MRPELLTPASWGKDPAADRDAVTAYLSLVGVTVSQQALESWTTLELALAFDWAARVHFKASDSLVRIRDKPSFITAAELLNAKQPDSLSELTDRMLGIS